MSFLRNLNITKQTLDIKHQSSNVNLPVYLKELETQTKLLKIIENISYQLYFNLLLHQLSQQPNSHTAKNKPNPSLNTNFTNTLIIWPIPKTKKKKQNSN